MCEIYSTVITCPSTPHNDLYLRCANTHTHTHTQTHTHTHIHAIYFLLPPSFMLVSHLSISLLITITWLLFCLGDYLSVRMDSFLLCLCVCVCVCVRACVRACVLNVPRWSSLREISAVRADGGEVRPASRRSRWPAVFGAAVSQWQRASPAGRPGERRAAARGRCPSLTPLSTMQPAALAEPRRGRWLLSCFHILNIAVVADPVPPYKHTHTHTHTPVHSHTKRIKYSCLVCGPNASNFDTVADNQIHQA